LQSLLGKSFVLGKRLGSAAVIVGMAAFFVHNADGQSNAIQPESPRRPAFEVASVKVNNSDGRNNVQISPTTLTIVHLPLANILIQAYDLPPSRIQFGSFESDFQQRYDISAKAAIPVPSGQILLMLQTLLVDRFHLAVHHEQRLEPEYALRVAPNGLNLRAAAPDEKPDFQVQPSKEVEPSVFQQSIEFKNSSIQQIAKVLTEKAMGKRVAGPSFVDKTGLQGGYDLTIEWTREQSPGSDPAPPAPASLSAALRKVGLVFKLEKTPIDILVVDHVEKATET
jgi:bla regulator protein BlaR1